MNKGIRFTDEFKQDAVAQVVERGYAVSEVAERLGDQHQVALHVESLRSSLTTPWIASLK
tara:strand:+ start:167 stop:346 length:180 start_codon:yes stop_codon:yes gene_type:complete